MIPRTIHQLWIGPNPAPVRWMQTWRDAHPTWRYELWTNERCAAFGFRNQREIDAMPEWSGKCDVMRYEILARHGGVFIDADAECLRPLDDTFLSHDAWTCYESEVVRPGLLACGYMGASRGCRLMERCVGLLSGADVARDRAWITVGNRFFTDAAAGYAGLHVYPAGLFIPEHHSGVAQAVPGVSPYARQLWGSTRGLYDGSGQRNALLWGAAAVAAAWWLLRR